MFVFGNLVLGLAKVIDIALTLYMWIVIARAVVSWVSPNPYNPIVQLLYRLTDPVLWRVRRYLPTFGFIDLSPILVILAIYFLKIFLVRTLYDIATRWVL
jgi:YggT family protein